MPIDTDIIMLIERLNKLSRLDETSLRKVFHTSLKHVANPGNPYIWIFTADVVKPSPVQRLELRVPTDKESAWKGMLILTIRQDRAVPIGEVRQHFGPPVRVEFPRAEAPVGTPTYESYEFPWGRLSFGYLPVDNRLREVILDRK